MQGGTALRDYMIVTDSCSDLGQEMIDELGIHCIPMIFNLEGKQYRNWPDGRELSFEMFYERLRAGVMSSTAQVNVAEFMDIFRGILQKGMDVLYLGFSSGLSGTVNSARMAAEELGEEFPDGKVIVVDTLCASLGEGLLVWHVAQRKKAGDDLETAAKWAEDNKMNLVHWFTVDDLNFLKRGGRLSGATAFFGTMLNIKPVLHVDNDGHLIAMEKVRGRKQSLNALVDHMEATAFDPAEQMVFISHGGAKEDLDYVADEVKRRLGVTRVYTNFIGPIVGSHSGPGTIALFFLGSKR